MIKIVRKRQMQENKWQGVVTPIYTLDTKEKERSHSEIKKYWELYLTDETKGVEAITSTTFFDLPI